MDINLFIDRTHFKYDRETNDLFQAENRENRLNLGQLYKHPEYYLLKYNKGTNKLSVPSPLSGIPPNDQISVSIPKAVFVSDDSACSVYNQFSLREGWNFFLADQAAMERLGGRLPEIEIDFQPYIVDLKLDEIRLLDNPTVQLALKDFQPVEDGRFYQAYFNRETQMIVDPEKEKGNLDDIYLLQIPNELGLDPVYMAQKAGLHDTAFLLQYPIEKKLKGELIGITVFKAKKHTSLRTKPDVPDRQRSAKRKPRR